MTHCRRRTDADLLRWIDYEIYLYDRAGHGFSSHIPKGFEYSIAQNLQDLRAVIQSRDLLCIRSSSPSFVSSGLDQREADHHWTQLRSHAWPGGTMVLSCLLIRALPSSVCCSTPPAIRPMCYAWLHLMLCPQQKFRRMDFGTSVGLVSMQAWISIIDHRSRLRKMSSSTKHWNCT